MIKIGQYNTLKVSRTVAFGVYLTDGSPTEILLPTRYLPESISVGDELTVFIYRDNENRLIATTERPYATVGEFAYLQVSQVNEVGAFLDWGIMKDILVPFREQKSRMRTGGIYLVYVYLDHATQRVVASAKVERFIGNVLPHYRRGDKVTALVTEHIPGVGYRVIVDNLHYGMIYENEIYTPVEVEMSLTAYVKQVRDDCKIDLTLGQPGENRISEVSEAVIKALENSPAGSLPVGDKSTPEEIKRLFHCSKKDFKKAIGHLYRDHKIILSESGITLPTID